MRFGAARVRLTPPRRPPCSAPVGAVLDMGSSGVWSALQALSALLLLAALAWTAKRGLLFGKVAAKSATMQVEERIALDLKNALVIVRVGERRLLLAVADAQPARLVCELSSSPATPVETP